MTRRTHRELAACLFAAVALLPVACSKSSGSAAAERPAVAVDVVRVAVGDLQQSTDVVGTLTSKFQGEVKTEYSGTITDVYVTEWVKVAKGTLLARFDRREPDAILKSATAARLQAQVAATRAQRELERTEKLKKAGLATQQNLDDAKTAAEAAEAQLEAARAQEDMARTRLAKTEVRSPMDGVVAARTVNPGDFIQNMGSDAAMFTIVDNRRLELTVNVPSSEIGRISVGQPLRFTTDAVSGRAFEGRVTFINPTADEASRTVKVIATVENPDNVLKSGFFVKGAIITGERAGVLRIPRGAILTFDPITRAGVVFVVANGKAERRNITIGIASGDEVEIATGLAAGDTVVARGAFNLRDGDRVSVVSGATGA